jgi:hypothetical protein
MNKNSSKVLKQRTVSGYYSVQLLDTKHKSKQERVHRLVAKYFINNDRSEIAEIVDHIDNNKLNNNVSNLRWVTHTENIKSYYDNHRDPNDNPVLQYDRDKKFIKEWMSVTEVLNIYNKFNRNNIYDCLTGKQYSAYGFIWKYKNDQNIITDIKLEKDEIFTNISVFEKRDLSNYEISNYGNVKSLHTNSIMKMKEYEGYNKIGLKEKNTKKKFSCFVHRLVAHIFVSGRTKKRKYVNHIDEIRNNNCYKNLEWVTKQENAVHSLAKKVNQIDRKTGKIINTFKTIRDAYEYLGEKSDNINGGTTQISYACNGKQKLAFGFKWSYANTEQKVSENIKELKDLNKIEGEIWKDIEGYEDKYKISNIGRVKSVKMRRCLDPHIEKTYKSTFLWNDENKRKKIPYTKFNNELVTDIRTIKFYVRMTIPENINLDDKYILEEEEVNL